MAVPTITRVREFMTTCPQTIEPDAVLAEARARMTALRARHLPVVRDGKLVGILSDRDVELTESLMVDAPRGSDPRTVGDAMTQPVFSCGPDAHLHAVAGEMARQRYGSAVVVDPLHPLRILGLFTTTDALRALAVLAPQEDPSSDEYERLAR